MPEFILASSAEANLDDIWNYFSEHKDQVAEKFIRDLIGKFQLFAENRENL
jgi:plasmid stabilization system protein ParE